jgi:hypothetical protein
LPFELSRAAANIHKLQFDGARAVDRSVARFNIAHYKRQLAEETDEARRKLLSGLLAEEEAKLAAAMAASEPAERKKPGK